MLAGHQKVADEILEPLVEHAAKRGVQFITFWAFSTENWNRDRAVGEGLMRIFKHVIGKRWARLHEKGVRIRTIGDLSKFSTDIQESLHKVIEQTKDNKKITAVFALNYGGRDEVLRAIHKLSDAKVATADELASLLDTAGIPDPDLIIRTSGEQRLSGFLPWQSVYSELYFPTWFMPEFTAEKLDEAIREFESRKRRFGK